MKKGSFLKNYGFLICMLIGIVAGCIVGAIWPATKDASGEILVKGATVLEPLGTVFLNLMFCIAVPTVFCSISSAIANMQSAKRAGKIMGVTIATFLATAAIAAVIMYVTVLIIPPVTGEYALIEGEVGGTLGVADMIVNFFTKPDFTELFSRRAILPLIVAAVLFGFGVQMAGGAETRTAKLLEDVTNCIMKTFKIITYYAPIGFFGFFAYLIAYHGPGQRRFQHGQLAQGVVGEDNALFAHLFRRLRNIERVVRNALEIGDRVQEFRGVLVLL